MDQVTDKIRDAHSTDLNELVDLFDTDVENGLSNVEFLHRLASYGPNVLQLSKRTPWYQVLMSQLNSAVIWVLLAAGLVSMFFGDWLDSAAIAIVIVINTAIGFGMEWQAASSMEALKKLAKSNCRVLREGTVINSITEKLVPGDILIAEAGDIIAADGRILETHHLSVKESALTGESEDVEKIAGQLAKETMVSDRNNMVFKGTIATHGDARILVTATAKDTELGKITTLVSEAEKSITPLEKKLSKLSKRIIYLTIGIIALIIVIGVIQQRDMVVLIETAIALAVAAIPEGLPIVATIALARGMIMLSKHNVIVKNLQAVQTLGEVTVICTDKTGTLTEDRMEALEVHVPSAIIARSSFSETAENKDLTSLLLTATLCNNASYTPGVDEATSGDSIEVALLKMAHECGCPKEKMADNYVQINEQPFDAENKYMAVLHKNDQQLRASVKGALEVILDRCDKILTDGKVSDLKDRDEWLKRGESLASQGLRILAFAFCTNCETNYDQNLTFQGIVTFQDPPRHDVREAINTCQEAGIKVVMVTGDHPGTAKNISGKTGITDDREALVMHGKDISSNQAENNILNTDVYARVSPAQKLDLVKAYQDLGLVVAMTGDGVNDAPALKKSDIGIAMGVRGTEAARDAADLILKDDAFSSIVRAIRQGRVIFNNIRNFVIYLLSCNISEIMVVAIAAFAGLPMPLFPLQILFLNIITDVFPALALGMGKGESDVMDHPPRKESEPILMPKHWSAVLIYGLAITISIIGLVAWARYSLKLDTQTVNNLAFYTLILAQLWNVFNLPAAALSLWKNEVTKNKYVWSALILCILLVILAYAIPVVRSALSLVEFPISYLGWIFLFSIIPVMIIQFLKRLLKWVI